jgi:hypothetical protein
MVLYTLEVHRECATLYLRDLPGATDLAMARELCGRLPASVRVLRVDLRGVAGISTFLRDNIIALAREWRYERLAEVSVAGMPDHCGPVAGTRSTAEALVVLSADAALTATFL